MNLSNRQKQYLRSLSRKKIRDKEKKFLLEGWRALKDALNSEFTIEYLVATKKAQELYPQILVRAQQLSIPLYTITEQEVELIANTEHSQGILALVHQKQWTLTDIEQSKAAMLIACDAISDPGNLGTMIRTCDWFGVDGMFLGKGSVSLYNEKVVRSTVGSLFHFPIVEEVNLPSVLSEYKNKGWKVLAATLDGDILEQQFVFPQKTILVFGNEAHGIQAPITKIADRTVTIQRYGRAESLNVSSACSVLLTLWRYSQRQRS
ncbi:MAG: RNA methyltransferase [Bacteroidetes bacterium]|nr:RNA methyltransferase [Bacteroidota bacterium]